MPRTVLTHEERREVYFCVQKGLPLAEIARRFRCSISRVSAIGRGAEPMERVEDAERCVGCGRMCYRWPCTYCCDSQSEWARKAVGSMNGALEQGVLEFFRKRRPKMDSPFIKKSPLKTLENEV